MKYLVLGFSLQGCSIRPSTFIVIILDKVDRNNTLLDRESTKTLTSKEGSEQYKYTYSPASLCS